jgi:hypothetical protein
MSWVRGLAIGVATVVVGLMAGYLAVLRPKLRAWGVDAREAALALPGDDLVPDAEAIETRGITIRATPGEIWPWLTQMGYGRAGWYSYDALDNKGRSADRLVPEFGKIAVGEIMPTHPGGGFEIKVLDRERALVLYSDTALVRDQAKQPQAGGDAETVPPGLKLSGGMLSASLPEFAASWAFYLEPKGPGETRLIERFRARTPAEGLAAAVIGELMGTGILLMTRKQMLGVKERAERPAGGEAAPTFESVPAV